MLVRIQTHLERARLVRRLQERNRALEEDVALRQRLGSERDDLADRVSRLSQLEIDRQGVAGLSLIHI